MNLSFINQKNEEIQQKLIGELITMKFKKNITIELPSVLLLLRLN